MTFNKQYEIKRPFAVRLGDVLYFDDFTTKTMDETGRISKHDVLGIPRPKYNLQLDPQLWGDAQIPDYGSSIIEVHPGELIRLQIKKPDELVTPNSFAIREKEYLGDLFRRGELPTGIFLWARYGNVNTSKLAGILDETLRGKKLVQPLGVVYKPVTIQDDMLRLDPKYINFVIDSKDVEAVEVLREKK